VVMWIVGYAVIYGVMTLFRESLPAQMADASARRVQVCNRVATFVHAVVSALWCARVLLGGPYFNVENTRDQLGVLSFSTSYFLFDFLWMLVFDFSFMFAWHHFAAVVIQAMFLFTGVGGYYGALGLGLGELTNPVQVIFLGAKDFGYRQTYLLLTPFFTYLFLFVRLLVIPPVALYSVIRASNTPELSRTWVLGFGFVMFALVIGSWVWCWSLWKGYRKLIEKGAWNEK